MMNTIKAIGLVLAGVIATILGVLLIAGGSILRLSPWLLALYVLVCLVYGIPMIPPGV
jgi:hypothetical protein